MLDDPDASTLGNVWPTLRSFTYKNGDGKPTLGYIAEELDAHEDTQRLVIRIPGANGVAVIESIDIVQLLIA